MKLKQLLLLLTCCSSGLVHAQTWNLRQCIDYALENNISLQQSKIQQKQSEVDLLSSKAQLFPSLSFSSSQNMSNSPWVESFSYTDGTGTMKSSSTTYNGSYGLNANWTVWNGGRRKMNIEASEISVEQAGLQAEQSANSIQEQILQYYVQILYAKEAVKVNEQVLETAIAQRNRAKERVEVGDLSKADLAQFEAQVAQNEYSVTSSKTAVERYKMQLKQLLELTGSTDFDIATIEVEDARALEALPVLASVYESALDNRPEIRNSQLNIDAANLNIDIAKAGKLPTLSMNASVGTSSNSANAAAWGKQLKNNWNNMVGLSISVPILSQRQNKSAVEKAKYQYQVSQLNLQDQQKNLYNTIEGYWLDATNAQAEFKSACASLESSQVSYDLLNEQFNVGLKNIAELLDGKNNVLQAAQNKLQSKYTAIMDQQLLKFYAGEPINL
ncbi:MAG: TolC family protein [Bacteroidaceae bacterium]|nr:TolC family protein [Bacteroidaceae bacterium]